MKISTEIASAAALVGEEKAVEYTAKSLRKESKVVQTKKQY